MKKFTLKAAVLVFSVLVLSACSTNSNVSTIQAPVAVVEAAQPVTLEVLQPGDPQGNAVAQQVRDQLFTKLVSRAKFSEVKPRGEEARYRLAVEVSGVKKVSVGARIFLGVLAGGDKLTAVVTLIDQESGSTVSSFKVQTEAASNWLSSDYGIASAVTQLTDKIVEGL